MQQKSVHWFPGHMQKAMRQIEEKLNLIDVVVELVDARAPFSSKNKYLENLTKNKKRVLVLSKKDLADSSKLKKWEEKFILDGYYPVHADLNNLSDIKKIIEAINKAGEERTNKYISRGMKPQPLRVLISGIPNVGKSTLINRLSKSRSASVANTPGHTKSQQWIKVGNSLELLDTPGILPPHYEDKISAIHLALIGSMKVETISETELSTYLISFLKKNHLETLKEKYSLTDEDLINEESIFKGIALRRGLLLPGGNYDFNKAELLLLKEFREGQLVKTVIDEIC